MDKNLIPIPILFNIFLPDYETDKDKKRKNTTINFWHFGKNNFSNRNLSRIGDVCDKTLSNDENKEKLISAFEKTN